MKCERDGYISSGHAHSAFEDGSYQTTVYFDNNKIYLGNINYNDVSNNDQALLLSIVKINKTISARGWFSAYNIDTTLSCSIELRLSVELNFLLNTTNSNVISVKYHMGSPYNIQFIYISCELRSASSSKTYKLNDANIEAVFSIYRPKTKRLFLIKENLKNYKAQKEKLEQQIKIS